jgi:exopolysaccharide production protein ExoZ
METGTPAKLEFLPRLESLRGIAAVSVVGYYAYSLCNDTAVTGMGPVVLFFVLSGFVLARSLEKNASPLAFFRHRMFRLVPAAASTVLLLTFLHWQFGFVVGAGATASFDPVNVLLNALMIRSDINSIMWSMTVECAATPLILACFFAHNKFGRVLLVVLSVILFGLSFYGPYVHLLGGFTNLSPLYAFVFGVLLHFMVMERSKPAPHQVAILAALSVTLIAVCWLRTQTGIVIFLESIGSGILIFLIAANSSDRMFAALDSTTTSNGKRSSTKRIPFAKLDGAPAYQEALGFGPHWNPNGHRLVPERILTLLSANNIIRRNTAQSKPARESIE